MRMKFLRILPETCANTWCLFSSSTRNMALGRGSITTAMTSIASSLLTNLFVPPLKGLEIFHRFAGLKACASTGPLKGPQPTSLIRQNHGPVLGHGHAVLE